MEDDDEGTKDEHLPTRKKQKILVEPTEEVRSSDFRPYAVEKPLTDIDIKPCGPCWPYEPYGD